ncbi:MAG: conjugal transfer protein TraF [Planctomycetota bacterium]|nr:conjugal transfer protein TraF [Planctomycetota bacterium]
MSPRVSRRRGGDAHAARIQRWSTAPATCMIAGDMRVLLALLVAATAGTRALAAPQASGPRGLAMGGTGVASSDPWTAPFTNPALTRFRDEGTGRSVMLPFLTATVRDDEGFLPAVDGYQDALDELKAQIDAMDPGAPAQRSAVVTRLQGLEGRTVNGETEVGFAALVPMEDYSACLWMRVRGEGRAFPDIATSDLVTITNPLSTSADLEDLDSEAVAIAAQRTEFGATFAVEGAFGTHDDARRVSFGITPKVQWIETYNYAIALDEFAIGDALRDLRDTQYERSSSAFNVDLGLAAELEKGAIVGLAIRDVFRQDHPMIATGGREFSYRVQPRTTLGVAVERAGLSFSADVDLTRTRNFREAPASQFFRMGVEANVFGQAQLRAGFAHDFEDGLSDLVSLGLGFSPAETARVDVVTQFGDNSVGAGFQIALTL